MPSDSTTQCPQFAPVARFAEVLLDQFAPAARHGSVPNLQNLRQLPKLPGLCPAAFRRVAGFGPFVPGFSPDPPSSLPSAARRGSRGRRDHPAHLRGWATRALRSENHSRIRRGCPVQAAADRQTGLHSATCQDQFAPASVLDHSADAFRLLSPILQYWPEGSEMRWSFDKLQNLIVGKFPALKPFNQVKADPCFLSHPLHPSTTVRANRLFPRT